MTYITRKVAFGKIRSLYCIYFVSYNTSLAAEKGLPYRTISKFPFPVSGLLKKHMRSIITSGFQTDGVGLLMPRRLVPRLRTILTFTMYHILDPLNKIHASQLKHGRNGCHFHYSDVIMGPMASQNTSPAIEAQIKENTKLRVTDHCARNSPLTGEFPAQRASNAENVSIWWRHHAHRAFWNGFCAIKTFVF